MMDAIDTDPGQEAQGTITYTEADVHKLHRRLASRMFQLVRKRDGQIVKFDRENITTAIFKAAQSVGGTERETAEQLADEVILYLYAARGSRLPGVEEIQDAIEKVLKEDMQGLRRLSFYIAMRGPGGGVLPGPKPKRTLRRRTRVWRSTRPNSPYS
jgi:hypothetical protein